MERNIEFQLIEWKKDVRRRPLILRGARQVGKTFVVEKFAHEHYRDLISINFELQSEYKKCFETLEPTEIIRRISILSKKEIKPGHTLLFLDEIQECPQAITALRYFYEKTKNIHVISAGSLLEFALRKKDFKMPVGRVHYVYMKPLSFGEFLTASGESELRNIIKNATPPRGMETLYHERAVTLLKRYLLLGGMPAVVDEYITSGNLGKCLDIQSDIIQTYIDDFPKYATAANHKYLSGVFLKTPKLIGQKFKYSKISRDIQSRFIKNAFELLEAAGIIYKVKSTSGAGVPLEAEARENHFKAIFLDVGLMQRLCGLDRDLILQDDILKINHGALAEQLVGQELTANNAEALHNRLYYWERTARGSTAEVDYLISKNGKVLPIEVKAGKAGRLLSLHIFLKAFGLKGGIQVSQAPFGESRNANVNIQSVPLYGIESLF